MLRQQFKNEPTDLLSVKVEENEYLSLDNFTNFVFTESLKNSPDHSDDSSEEIEVIKKRKSKSPFKDDTARRKPKVQDFRCFFCNKVFEKISLKNIHVKTDHQTELQCTICKARKSSSLAAERCIKDHTFGFDYLCQVILVIY